MPDVGWIFERSENRSRYFKRFTGSVRQLLHLLRFRAKTRLPDNGCECMECREQRGELGLATVRQGDSPSEQNGGNDYAGNVR